MKLDQSKLTLQISEALLRWRWPLMLLISMLVLAVELYEHRFSGAVFKIVDFVREVFLFALLLPLLNGIVLTLLARTRQDKVSAVRDLTQQHNLSKQLNQASTWDELLSIIIRFPQNNRVVIGSSLYLSNFETDTYELVASWSREGLPPIDPAPGIVKDTCDSCIADWQEKGISLKSCPEVILPDFPSLYQGYCLPLIHRAEVVAILVIYYPVEATVVARQDRVLAGAAPEMAMALERYRLELKAANQEELAFVERRRIARNLHDTLGQNISYLRLKLDQLSGDNALQEISVIRQDLERMRDIADDAYSQVRNTLADLEPTRSVDFIQALAQLSNQVGLRAGFDAHVKVIGTPRTISEHARRQILFICRECLNNIEKHARAQHVFLEVDWAPNALRVSVRDDGAGFNQAEVELDGHYGLAIMHERADEIGAQLTIHSQPASGTQITLFLPEANSSMVNPDRLTGEMSNTPQAPNND